MPRTRYVFDQSLAIEWGQKIGLALVILLVTWLLARAAHWAFAKLVDRIAFLRRGTSSGQTVGQSLGRVVGLLIWLVGILAILQVFNLGGVLAPVQGMLDSILRFVPRLIGAGLIFFVGLVLARIVRDLVVTGLQTVDLDKWVSRGGIDTATGTTAISKTIGTVVYVLIIIPVAIVALDTLDMEAISQPAGEMLRMILDAVPRVIGAGIVLGIGYVIAKFVAQILTELLPGLGVDRAIESIEVLPEGTSASTVIARVVQIAIMLFAAIAATRLLGFPDLTAILDAVLKLGGRVVFGGAVILIGFLIANLLARAIGGTEQSNLAAAIVRWSAIVLFTFMGLQFMGVGEDIVRMAFGALVIGAGVAGALAFGLGGRDAAARALENMRANPPKAPPPPPSPRESARKVKAQTQVAQDDVAAAVQAPPRSTGDSKR
jgi:hypothetical protein